MSNIVKANGTVAFSKNTNDSKTIIIVPIVSHFITLL